MDLRQNRSRFALRCFTVMLFFGNLTVLARPAPEVDIHEIAGEGKLEAVKEAVVENPGLVNLRDDDGQTPLFAACRGDHPAVVKYLVAHGADVNAKDDYLDTPMHLVAYRGLIDPMKVLLEHKAEVNVQNHSKKTPLHYAALADRHEAAALLIAAQARLEIPDDYGRTSLVLCARERGGPETIKVLLEAGAKTNARDKFDDDALKLAAWRGKKEVVDLLLEAGAEVPANGPRSQELLEEAADHGLTRLFQDLVRAGGDPDFELSNGRTLVHAAAAGGSVKILQTLASRELELDRADQLGWRPLHYAARDGRTECVEWLVRKKVQINSRTLMGQTAFNISQEREMPSVTEVLKASGAETGPMQFPILEGPYLGQEPPGETPERFATGIVSSVWGLHSSVAFSPKGDDVLWSPMVEWPGEIYSRGNIAMMHRHKGRWAPPELAPFTEGDRGDVGFFSPDGERVYFLSRRTLPDEPESRRERIWYADRNGEGWADARLVDPIVNDYPQHWQFSVDGSHAIYFSADLPGGQGNGDIYRSVFVKGKWQEPINLGPPINTAEEEATPFISPDGSYLIVQRDGDLYLSFQTDSGGWSSPQNLGEPINSSSGELCPIVSPDGKHLFFNSRRGGSNHVYWVSADFIEKMRPKGGAEKRPEIDTHRE